MYYSSNGSYRKSKMMIDIANIVLTILIGIMFVAVLILRSRSGKLFPMIFIAGGCMNGLTAAKNFMNYNKPSGIVLGVVAAALLVLAAISWQIV